MKKRRLGIMLLLFVFTLGIYRFYWLAKTRREMIAKGNKIPTIWLLIVPYLLIILTFAMMIAGTISMAARTKDYVYSCMTQTGNTQTYCEDLATYKVKPPAQYVVGIIFVYLSLLLVFPLTALWYWPYSRAVDAVTKNKMGFAIAMIVLLAVPDVFDMLIVQDSFNKVPSR